LAGFYLDKQGLIHGFVEINGTLTTLDVPGAFRTEAYGMNDSGVVVGGFSDATGEHGFSYNGVKYSTIDLGTQHFTVATGINNAGQIIGYYGATGGTTLGFLDTNGKFTTIKTNNAVTEPLGINSSGVVVGIEGTETEFMSFMYQNGRFLPIPIVVPSSYITQAEAINDSGQIVGWFLFQGSPLEGFTALP
jgi:probable HAF family extracellular repeat protein